MVSLGNGGMALLNTGKYKDINNDDMDTTVNRGEKLHRNEYDK